MIYYFFSSIMNVPNFTFYSIYSYDWVKFHQACITYLHHVGNVVSLHYFIWLCKKVPIRGNGKLGKYLILL